MSMLLTLSISNDNCMNICKKGPQTSCFSGGVTHHYDEHQDDVPAGVGVYFACYVHVNTDVDA
jgi:hypothetical protein